MTPMPPERAMAMAIRSSHTVSMLAATMGAASESARVKRPLVSTSPREPTPERNGVSRTSSYVRARGNGSVTAAG